MFIIIRSYWESIWLNYKLSGVWYKLKYPNSNSTSGIVEGSQLTYPSGWEAIKGVFGQRVIK